MALPPGVPFYAILEIGGAQQPAHYNRGDDGYPKRINDNRAGDNTGSFYLHWP